jgi:hypothetical protein
MAECVWYSLALQQQLQMLHHASVVQKSYSSLLQSNNMPLCSKTSYLEGTLPHGRQML